MGLRRRKPFAGWAAAAHQGFTAPVIVACCDPFQCQGGSGYTGPTACEEILPCCAPRVASTPTQSNQVLLFIVIAIVLWLLLKGERHA